MRQTRLKYAGIAMLGAAALVLTGCSADAEPTAEDHPLYKYFDALSSGEEWTQEKFDEQQKVEQEYIAECMSKQGFEYTPDLQNGGMVMAVETDEEDSGPDWGTLEFAEQYGYGVVEWPGMNDFMGDEGDEYVDPNADYIASLSESEQIAYYEALHGPSPTEEEWALMEEEENYEWNPENNGCWGEANEAAYNDPFTEAYEDPEFADLFEAIDLVYEDVQSHDNITALNRDWLSCMSEAGFTEFTSRDEANQMMHDEWYAITDELNANTGEYDEWKEPSQEQKDEFQQREIEVATADFTCAEKLKWDSVWEKTDLEVSQAFVDKNKASLDALVAKYGQGN